MKHLRSVLTFIYDRFLAILFCLALVALVVIINFAALSKRTDDSKKADVEKRVIHEDVPILKLIINQHNPELHTILLRKEKNEVKVAKLIAFAYTWKKENDHYANDVVTIECSYFDDAKPGASYVRLWSQGATVSMEFHIESF